MGNIGSWDKTVPSGTSSIRHGDDLIRSDKSVQQAAWETEHYLTDGSTSSTGIHKLGSARIFSGSTSAVSQVADTGRLMLALSIANPDRLWSVGTGQVAPLGPRVGRIVENHTSVGSTANWITSAITGDNDTSLNFGPVYGGVPVVQVSVQTSESTTIHHTITSLTSRAITVACFDAVGGAIVAGAVAVHVLSFGSVAHGA